MTDTALPSPLTLSSGVERMLPTLTPAQVKRIAVHGRVRSIRTGEVLVEAGEQVVPFFVVTTGRVEIVRPSGTAESSPRSMDRVSSRAPHLLETSLPGVFAVGDVRGGNIKRVASAVGEGSIAISLLPELGELQILSQSSSGFTKPSSGASTDCFIHRIATEAGPKGPLKQLLPRA